MAEQILEQTALEAKLRYCKGCRNDFYNGHNDIGVKHCWSLQDAEVVRRYRIHWWTQMDKANNFTLVSTLSCHHETGQFAFLKDLPEHLRGHRSEVKVEGR